MFLLLSLALSYLWRIIINCILVLTINIKWIKLLFKYCCVSHADSFVFFGFIFQVFKFWRIRLNFFQFILFWLVIFYFLISPLRFHIIFLFGFLFYFFFGLHQFQNLLEISLFFFRRFFNWRDMSKSRIFVFSLFFLKSSFLQTHGLQSHTSS